jgi:Na+-transporting methylmalonyl-CoA/oxaloacetate decarboxylase gamma subunit
MQNDLALVLLITVVGMGSVFTVIILLSFLMSLLVRLTTKREPQAQPQAIAAEDELRQRAAIAAVAVLRARETALAPLRFPLPHKALVSAWQAVLRSNILNKRGHVR